MQTSQVERRLKSIECAGARLTVREVKAGEWVVSSLLALPLVLALVLVHSSSCSTVCESCGGVLTMMMVVMLERRGADVVKASVESQSTSTQTFPTTRTHTHTHTCSFATTRRDTVRILYNASSEQCLDYMVDTQMA